MQSKGDGTLGHLKAQSLIPSAGEVYFPSLHPYSGIISDWNGVAASAQDL